MPRTAFTTGEPFDRTVRAMLRPLSRLAATTSLTALALAAPAAAAPAPLLFTPHTTIPGASVTGEGGDINGDGRDDLIVATPSCATSVIFGSATPATINPTSPGSRGFVITNGCANWKDVGDTNGDGRDDIAAKLSNGVVQVIYGRTATTPVNALAVGTAGVRIAVPANLSSNFSLSDVAAVGDVNGDGRDDVGIEGRIREPGTSPARAALGVVFSPAMGGAVDAGSTTTPGLLVFNSRREDGAAQPYRFSRVGDVNRDGRADLLFSVARPAVDQGRIVLGRAQPGAIDLATAPATTLPGRGEFRPVGDLNRDGLQEQTIGGDGLGGEQIALSTAASPYFDFAASSRLITLRASFAAAGVGIVGGGDLTGDGTDDVTATPPFTHEFTGSFLGPYMSLGVPHLHLGANAGTTDVRTADRRIDGVPHRMSVRDLTRFTGRTTSDVVADGYQAGIAVGTLGPAPTDTTAPSLDNVRFDKTTISRSCTACNNADTSRLLYRVNEPVWMELTLRRGSTTVGTARGPMPAGSDDVDYSYEVRAVICGVFDCAGSAIRMPAGTYTATLRGTDRSGNRSATRTATIVVQ